MAIVNFTWFGFVVEFSHQEITQITTLLNSGAAGSGALGGLLGSMGITGTSAAITTAVASAMAALLKLGSSILNGCNHQHAGIYLFVLWVGPFWCRSRR
jgi:hypothetical protein